MRGEDFKDRFKTENHANAFTRAQHSQYRNGCNLEGKVK